MNLRIRRCQFYWAHYDLSGRTVVKQCAKPTIDGRYCEEHSRVLTGLREWMSSADSGV